MHFALIAITTLSPALPPQVQQIRNDPRLQAKMCAALTAEHQEPLRPVDSFGPDDPPSQIEARDALTTLLIEAHEPWLRREAYRATVETAFLGNLTVRVDVHNETATLVAKVWPLLGATAPLCRRTTRELDNVALMSIRRCFSERDPWTRPQAIGEDGSTWYIEANDNEGYRIAHEWAPSRSSPLKRCSALLAKLSGQGFVGLDR
jgi:hypothetical protein